MEGFEWYKYGNYDMATTQLKFTSVLTSMLACVFAYLFIRDKEWEVKERMITKKLIKIGDCSFGIYLSHVAVMAVLNNLPGYSYIIFPITPITTLTVTTICVIIGNKLLGKKIGRYLGLN